MDKKKDLAERLRTSGLRPTKQRIKLAEFLFNREKTFHFTVENLDRSINKKNSEDKIALATIYNTVHAFKKAGHLKEIIIKEGKNYFDTNTTSHHHFYDEMSNELTDIENGKIELKKFPTPPKGKSIKEGDSVKSYSDNIEAKRAAASEQLKEQQKKREDQLKEATKLKQEEQRKKGL